MTDLPPLAAVPLRTLEGTRRWNVIDGLPQTGNLGIELGVAAGSFSAQMVASGRFRRFFGVDVYGDRHDTRQYKQALAHVGLMADYSLLRMTFDEALDLFPDGFFDFIYVDGYAHTGEEGGRTMTRWFAKLKPGGIMAGDDYDAAKWPLVVWGVHHLVAQLGVELCLTDLVEEETYGKFRSWFFVKPAEAPAELTCDPTLIKRGAMARAAHLRRGRRAAKDTPPPES